MYHNFGKLQIYLNAKSKLFAICLIIIYSFAFPIVQGKPFIKKKNLRTISNFERQQIKTEELIRSTIYLIL